MKRNRSTLPLIVFILGIAVLALAFIILLPLFEERKSRFVFSFVCVSVLYLITFIPFLTGFFKGDTAKIMAGTMVYFKGVVIYGVLSAADIALAFTPLPLNIPIVVQCVALLVFVIWACLATAAKDHITTVQNNETAKISPVMNLRSRAQKLSALASMLDKNDPARVWAEKTAENLRYLSPGNNNEQHELEAGMLAALDSILADSYFAGGAGAVPETQMNTFDMLYAQRKNMR